MPPPGRKSAAPCEAITGVPIVYPVATLPSKLPNAAYTLWAPDENSQLGPTTLARSEPTAHTAHPNPFTAHRGPTLSCLLGK